jgi:hypothetical protein
MVSVSKQFGRKVEGGILQNPARESNAVEHHVSGSPTGRHIEPETVAVYELSRILRTAVYRSAEAPAFELAGASGWAVNGRANILPKECHHSDVF